MELNGNKKKNIKRIEPSKVEIKSLIEYYQNGLYKNAENLAHSIAKDFPKHQFAWKVLGVIYKKTGRVSESLAVTKKAVKLSPKDAQAHLNLGIIFKELGKLNDAEDKIEEIISQAKSMTINGVKHPRQMFQWTTAELKAVGIVPVTTTGTPLNGDYYIEKSEEFAIAGDKNSVVRTIGVKVADKKLDDEDSINSRLYVPRLSSILERQFTRTRLPG